MGYSKRKGAAPSLTPSEVARVIEKRRWCVIPPNEETTDWRIYDTFDDEGGYQDEIGGGETLAEAVAEALTVLPTPKSDRGKGQV